MRALSASSAASPTSCAAARARLLAEMGLQILRRQLVTDEALLARLDRRDALGRPVLDGAVEVHRADAEAADIAVAAGGLRKKGERITPQESIERCRQGNACEAVRAAGGPRAGEGADRAIRGDAANAFAAGVGDLKRVLTNVKTRGVWGEVQLAAILEEVLTPAQYERNVATTGTAERVEFAVKLPGREANRPCWLPIDSKFPTEDYQRLLDAQHVDPLADRLLHPHPPAARTAAHRLLAVERHRGVTRLVIGEVKVACPSGNEHGADQQRESRDVLAVQPATELTEQTHPAPISLLFSWSSAATVSRGPSGCRNLSCPVASAFTR